MNMDAAAMFPGHLAVDIVYVAIIDIDMFVNAFFSLRQHIDGE